MFNDTTIARLPGPWGIPIEIGSTFALLLVILFGVTGAPDIYTITFVAVIVGSILLHELGHAWGCIIQGVPVARIKLYGGGGFCQPARSPSRHQDELIVAMGPIVNIVLWALASLASDHVGGGMPGVILWQIKVVNLVLFALNMLPVQPLDGGKLFHLALARVLPARTATRVAGFVGLVIAVLWVPGMFAAWLYFGIFLVFIPPIGLHWQMFKGN